MGDLMAQNNLGSMYGTGKGTDIDLEKSVYWIKKSANGGNAAAQNTLGCFYRDAVNEFEQNYEKANYWFKKAAENNNALAFKNMAKYYAEGKFVKQDYEKAYYWITRGKGKNVRTSHDDFIAEIKSHLTPEQIKKIDDQNQKFLEKL